MKFCSRRMWRVRKQGRKTNKRSSKSTLCVNVSSNTVPCAKLGYPLIIAKSQRGSECGKVLDLPVSNALKAAQETSSKRRKKEATVQESIVRLKGSQVKCTQADRVDAQTGGLQPWPTVPPSLRPSAAKSPQNFKAAPTATTALTPQRRRQIVESRDPISRHHVTGNRGNRFNLQRQTAERRWRQWVVAHGLGGWRKTQVREGPIDSAHPRLNLNHI